MPLPGPPPQTKLDTNVDDKVKQQNQKTQSGEDKLAALATYRMAKVESCLEGGE
jgi:hypothetical protein